jgi:hypothetical protein
VVAASRAFVAVVWMAEGSTKRKNSRTAGPGVCIDRHPSLDDALARPLDAADLTQRPFNSLKI